MNQQFQVPPGAKPGDYVQVPLSNGTIVTAIIPDGAHVGDTVNIPIPGQTVLRNDTADCLDATASLNKLAYCNTFTVSRVISAFCLALCLGIVATVVHFIHLTTGNSLFFFNPASCSSKN